MNQLMDELWRTLLSLKRMTCTIMRSGYHLQSPLSKVIKLMLVQDDRSFSFWSSCNSHQGNVDHWQAPGISDQHFISFISRELSSLESLIISD